MYTMYTMYRMHTTSGRIVRFRNNNNYYISLIIVHAGIPHSNNCYKYKLQKLSIEFFFIRIQLLRNSTVKSLLSIFSLHTVSVKSNQYPDLAKWCMLWLEPGSQMILQCNTVILPFRRMPNQCATIF